MDKMKLSRELIKLAKRLKQAGPFDVKSKEEIISDLKYQNSQISLIFKEYERELPKLIDLLEKGDAVKAYEITDEINKGIKLTKDTIKELDVLLNNEVRTWCRENK